MTMEIISEASKQRSKSPRLLPGLKLGPAILLMNPDSVNG